MWPYEMLTGNLRYLALLNPFFYITEGYRATFLYHSWMFQNVEMTVYFLLMTTLIFIAGRMVFRKLRPQFADVL
jgi:ABC-type polysaccharide/polyol phosphate export permease